MAHARTPPDKPDGDRDSLSLTEHGITLETMTEKEMDYVTKLGPGEGTMKPEEREFLMELGLTKQSWDMWIEMLFAHRYVPIPLFDTISKDDYNVVKKTSYGNLDRPVLKRGRRFTSHMIDAGKTVCLDYAVRSDKSPKEVCDEVPFDFFPFEIMRVREFIEENDVVWVTFDNKPWYDRSPIGHDRGVRGIMYFMYVLRDGDIVPKYIGISRKENALENGLNWNFANVTSDSVFARWGYGSSQHLGELSCTFWPEQYSWEPSRKYKNWQEELFVDGTRLLKEPVYIEVLPWFSDDLIMGEENLVTYASELFPEHLLNVEYNR